MPIAITEEQRAVQDSIGAWAVGAGTHAAIRAREDQRDHPPDREYWNERAGFGLFGMALPAAMGGAGGTTVDLATTLEQAAAELVPGPLLPTALAGLVLREIAEVPAAKQTVLEIAEGTVALACTLDGGTLRAEAAEGGGLIVSGAVGRSSGLARPNR
ncbi:MAG: acyl-CoA dehydrogenase family protein [Sciscionella sp.]